MFHLFCLRNLFNVVFHNLLGLIITFARYIHRSYSLCDVLCDLCRDLATEEVIFTVTVKITKMQNYQSQHPNHTIPTILCIAFLVHVMSSIAIGPTLLCLLGP